MLYSRLYSRSWQIRTWGQAALSAKWIPRMRASSATRKERREETIASINRKSLLSANLPVYPSIYLSAYYVRLGLFTVDAYKNFFLFLFHSLHAFESFFREAAQRDIRVGAIVLDSKLRWRLARGKERLSLPRHDRWTGSSPLETNWTTRPFARSPARLSMHTYHEETPGSLIRWNVSRRRVAKFHLASSYPTATSPSTCLSVCLLCVSFLPTYDVCLA